MLQSLTVLARSFLGRSLAFGALGLSALLAVNGWQAAQQTERSIGLCTLAAMKREAAHEAGAGKVMLIGGSGVTMGFNATMMARQLRRPVVNFGLQASLGPQLILGEAQRVLRPGDVAVLALEYYQYGYDRPTDLAQDFLLGCGRPHLAELSLLERARFFLSVNPLRRLRWVDHPGRLRDRTYARQRERFTWRGDRALDPAGWPPLPAVQRQRMAHYRPLSIDLDPSRAGPRAITAFIDWARRHRVTVLATYPNTIAFPAYDRHPGLAEIRRFYAVAGVPMVGGREIAHLDAALFYDTQYHMTPTGILERTRRFLKPLRAALAPVLARETAPGPDESS